MAVAVSPERVYRMVLPGVVLWDTTRRFGMCVESYA